MTRRAWDICSSRICRVSCKGRTGRRERPEIKEDNMLIAIANGESHFSAQDVNQRYSLGAPQTVSRNKQTLIKKDIIEKDGDSYTFVDPIFKFWFKKNHRV